MGATRIDLPQWESSRLLERQTLGRLCIIDHGYPLAFPINYRLIHEGDRTRLVFRTNPGSAMARYSGPASLEVDWIDMTRPVAWSVIARGKLRRAVGYAELVETNPLIGSGRFQWLVLEVAAISGRRFTAARPEGDLGLEWEPVSSGSADAVPRSRD
jgi:hypothetical protein